MKNYKFKQGFKPGSVSKVVPGVGLMRIDENISDADAKKLIDAGVHDIFESVRTPAVKASTAKPTPKDGKEQKRTATKSKSGSKSVADTATA